MKHTYHGILPCGMSFLLENGTQNVVWSIIRMTHLVKLPTSGGAVQSGSGCGESSGSRQASKQVVAQSK